MASPTPDVIAVCSQGGIIGLKAMYSSHRRPTVRIFVHADYLFASDIYLTCIPVNILTVGRHIRDDCYTPINCRPLTAKTFAVACLVVGICPSVECFKAAANTDIVLQRRRGQPEFIERYVHRKRRRNFSLLESSRKSRYHLSQLRTTFLSLIHI